MSRSYSKKERRAFTDANRAAWDEAAPRHAKINQSKLLEAFSKPGYSTFDDHCRDRLKEIGFEGKSVAQLCCNNGQELLSLKNLGAGRCIGFDMSAAFIAQARELAAVSGQTGVEFVIADIYDLPTDERGPYDIVMTTIGVFGWMPNLEEFFDVVARLTRSGGHFFMEESHPVLMMYEEGEGGEPSYLAYSYFKEDPWVETSGIDYYEGIKYPSKTHYCFQHTLADIIMAAINAGFVLRHFAELDFDITRMCADLEHAAARPPLGMTMVWEKS